MLLSGNGLGMDLSGSPGVRTATNLTNFEEDSIDTPSALSKYSPARNPAAAPAPPALTSWMCRPITLRPVAISTSICVAPCANVKPALALRLSSLANASRRRGGVIATMNGLPGTSLPSNATRTQTVCPTDETAGAVYPNSSPGGEGPAAPQRAACAA
jgi:hypothetical protein